MTTKGAKTDNPKPCANTWASTEVGRKAYHANRAGLDLNEDEGHAALGVDSIYAFTGDLGAAFDLLKNFAAGKAEAEADRAEAAEREELYAHIPEYVAACEGRTASPVWLKTRFQRGPGLCAWDLSIQVNIDPVLLRVGMQAGLEVAAEFDQTVQRNRFYPVYHSSDIPTFPEPEREYVPPSAPPPTAQQPAATAQPSAPPPPSGPPRAVGHPTTPAAPPVQSPAPPANGGLVREPFTEVRVTAPKGKPLVEFWRDGRKYPEVTWGLGGEALLGLPGAEPLVEAGWLPEHLDTVGNVYQMAAYGFPNCIAFWQRSPKDARYKDIMSLEIR